MQDPQPIDQDNWLRFEGSGTSQPAMRLKIVAGNWGFAPVEAIPDDAVKGRPIYADWIVEIEFSAAGWGKVRAIPVKIVQREMGGFAAQDGQEFFGQPGFAGAATARDGNQERKGRRTNDLRMRNSNWIEVILSRFRRFS